MDEDRLKKIELKEIRAKLQEHSVQIAVMGEQMKTMQADLSNTLNEFRTDMAKRDLKLFGLILGGCATAITIVLGAARLLGLF